jgi:hypothetical protein
MVHCFNYTNCYRCSYTITHHTRCYCTDCSLTTDCCRTSSGCYHSNYCLSNCFEQSIGFDCLNCRITGCSCKCHRSCLLVEKRRGLLTLFWKDVYICHLMHLQALSWRKLASFVGLIAFLQVRFVWTGLI